MANCLKEPATIYNTPNGVKPRYDGNGNAFSDGHRDLGPGYLMFDIDRLFVRAESEMVLRRENEAWVECRKTGETVTFIAILEYKSRKTQFSLRALDPSEWSSLARLELARKLECRLFVVFASDGRAPLEFWEISTDDGVASMVGILEYESCNAKERWQEFYDNVLKMPKPYWRK